MWIRFWCWLGWCMRCRTQESETELWGQCIDCGKRHGVVSRADIRRYIEREKM
jgi:hypothetical protein